MEQAIMLYKEIQLKFKQKKPNLENHQVNQISQYSILILQLRFSESYFKKISDVAESLFKRNENSDINDSAKKSIREPQTLNESSAKIDLSIGEQNFAKEKSFPYTFRQSKSAKDVCSNQNKITTIQNNNIKNSDSCSICLTSEADGVLMDCGHGAICFKCGLTILKTICKCHLCRKPIIQVLKIDTKFCQDDLLKVLDAADLNNIKKYDA